jgi:hypothetical protein
MGRVGTCAGHTVCIPHHNSPSCPNWTTLHGNLGSKFFCLEAFRKAAGASLPVYDVPHFLGEGFPNYPEKLVKRETSILDILNLSQPLGTMEVAFQTDYVPFKSADAETFRSALDHRLRLGLGTPLGFRDEACI